MTKSNEDSPIGGASLEIATPPAPRFWGAGAFELTDSGELKSLFARVGYLFPSVGESSIS